MTHNSFCNSPRSFWREEKRMGVEGSGWEKKREGTRRVDEWRGAEGKRRVVKRSEGETRRDEKRRREKEEKWSGGEKRRDENRRRVNGKGGEWRRLKGSEREWSEGGLKGGVDRNDFYHDYQLISITTWKLGSNSVTVTGRKYYTYFAYQKYQSRFTLFSKEKTKWKIFKFFNRNCWVDTV